MSGFLIEEGAGQLDCLARLRLSNIRMNPQFDCSPHFSGVVGPVEQMLPGIRVICPH